MTLPLTSLLLPGVSRVSLKSRKQEKWKTLGPRWTLPTTHLPSSLDPTTSRQLNSSDQVSEAKRAPRPPASLVSLAWYKAPLSSCCFQLSIALGAEELGMGHDSMGQKSWE